MLPLPPPAAAAMIFSSANASMRGDEAEPAAAATPNSKKQKILVLAEGDGSSVEVAKRPRGRPPGSKNKPKPPIIVTRESEPSAAMRPHILEIPSGHDVIDSIVRFSRRKNLGVCVLSGTGAVLNVTLRQPPHPTAAVTGTANTVGFHGRFEILSLSAAVMPPAVSAVFSSGASVSLAGPQGQVMGGTVVGPLVAAGTVTVVAATFENPTFHRLPPVEDEVARSVSVSGGGDESSGPHTHHQQQQQEEEEAEAEAEAEENQQRQHYVHREYQLHHHHHHGHHQHQQQQVAAESCGLAMYGSHMPSDFWAPTARPPHPPPY